MKENVFDVLIYLFENYMDGSEDLTSDPDQLRDELLEAGFPQAEIAKAFDWMDSLANGQMIEPTSTPAFRVFSQEEAAKLDTECRGFLLALEQGGILTPASRELVLDRIMAFEGENLTLENLKWITMMVLFSQPDEELAFAKMESLVYGSLPDDYLH
jgi:Smg protein